MEIVKKESERNSQRSNGGSSKKKTPPSSAFPGAYESDALTKEAERQRIEEELNNLPKYPNDEFDDLIESPGSIAFLRKLEAEALDEFKKGELMDME